MKRLVVAGGAEDEMGDECAATSTSDSEIKIVTVTTEDIVTLATEALAASSVAQLTGQRALPRPDLVFLERFSALVQIHINATDQYFICGR